MGSKDSLDKIVPAKAGDAKKIRLFERICDRAAAEFGLSHRAMVFLDGDTRTAYLMRKGEDGLFKNVQIAIDNGKLAPYWLVATGKGGFSVSPIEGTTPTGMFIAGAPEPARKNIGKSVGFTEHGRTMWSVFMRLHGQERENKLTASRTIGAHGSTYQSSILNQEAASDGCIRFLAQSPGGDASKTQTDKARIEHLLAVLEAEGKGGLPLFIYVSDWSRMHRSQRKSGKFLPERSARIVQEAREELGIAKPKHQNPQLPVQPKPAIQKPETIK